ncbi:hypothetical protein [Candidatus Poriferisodalis sp.]|uniref:hypothetical protein n=1 Tax=Candidatus Poriferisodalis sp. TaxID=3101277 RepID=UPI003B02E3E4
MKLSWRRGTSFEGGRPIGLQRIAGWTFAVVLVVLPLAVTAARSDAAAAQTSVAPVLSCGSGMMLDSASGTCLTVRTETVARSRGCSTGWNAIAGPGGSLLCQRRTERRVDTGRTRRVYSHTTTSQVWIRTGTQLVQTGTRRVWVPPRTLVYPLVPPVRVQVGTETVTTRVTIPGPPVRFRVSYEAEVTLSRRVQRCAFDPFAGEMCWYETVTETTTETRTRLVCCRPGPDIVQTITREIPQYEWQTTYTSTEPGRWETEPVYAERETGYWRTVESVHYTTEPVYETVVDVQSQPPSYRACAVGWKPVGHQCQRTVLGQPSAAPAQRCPAGFVPRYGDTPGGTGNSVLACQPNVPGSSTDTGASQDDSGGSETPPDGGARPLHHLAGESDERLAELGIQRCSNGLLSYVACEKLPGRTWDSDPRICDDIDGTTYRPDHGGSCVTGSDLLNKCTTPGDCEETTIRTYCPAIGQLTDTQIQEHAHPDRGAETYRVCIFDCSNFAALPPYVQSRINGSYDYACLPAPDEVPSTTTTATTATTTTSTTSTTSTAPTATTTSTATTAPTTATTAPTTATTAPSGDDDDDDDRNGIPPIGTTVPPDDKCASVPPADVAADALDGLRWTSHVRFAGASPSPQQRMPGDGRYLQVAPGRSWIEIRGPVDVSDHKCQWSAAWLRVSWTAQRPWVAAERRAMEADPDTRHLVMRWDALSADQQQTVRHWHRPGAAPAEVVCTVGDASGARAPASCGWMLMYPAAYAWQTSVCFEAEDAPGTPGSVQRRSSTPAADDPCWVLLASGMDWIRTVSDYANARVTVTQSGARP